MHKRLITLLVMVIAGVLMLVTNGQTAHAVTEPSDINKADETRTVMVQKGDYLDKIAQDNDTTFLRLFYANDEIKDPDLIYEGQKLRVPDASENLTPRPLPEDVAATSVQPVMPSTRSAAPQAVATAPAPRQTVPTASSVSGGIWDQLAMCESGGNWSINTGNGYYGGLQFTLSSWQAVGGSGYPHLASKSEQIYRAQLLQARQGWGAWPACSAKLGLL
jgi:LysM repeat protein